jgi:hypothetical protein
MATARAVASGNWSAGATWNGGVVPGNGDTVYAGGFNVTLDVDITIGGANNPTVNAGSFVSGQWYEITFVGTTTWTSIGAASNTLGAVFLATGAGSGTGTAKARATISTAANAAAGAAAGGSFIMSTVRTFTPDIRAGTTTCLSVTATTGTLTLSGIIVAPGGSAGAQGINNASTASIALDSGSTLTGGTTANAGVPLNNASTGSITFDSCTLSSGTTTGQHCIFNASTGSISATNCTITGATGGSATGAIQNNSTGSVTITSCTVIGGTGSVGYAINNNSTGSISATGSTFTASGAPAIFNNSTGAVTITTSTITASSANVAVSVANTAADIRLSGDFLDHWSGWRAVGGNKWRVYTTPTNARTRYALDGTTDSYLNMFTADNNLTQALPADVRSGTVYADGNLTGACAVPAAASVAYGVPVDDTTGTAFLSQSDVLAAVWGAATTSLTTAGSIGERLKNCASVDSTGTALATALTAPAP